MLRGLISLSCLFSLCLCAGSTAVGQSVHKDSEFGYRISVPKGWTKAPLSHREKWIVAKFVSKRQYVGKKEPMGHRPDLRVILFPKAVTSDRGVKVKVSADKTRINVSVKNPYKNFDDYLKKHAYGGYYKVSEEKKKINGIDTTCIEIRFEKLTVPRRAFAYIYHQKDADFVAYVEGLEDHWKKLKPIYLRALKSFKFIKRTGSLIRQGGTTGNDIEFLGAKKLTPKEKEKRRTKRFERELKNVSANRPAGWKIKKSKNYVALTHTDAKYTKRVLAQAEAVRKWLDKNFGWISKNKAGSAIIRICKDSTEERAFSGGSRDAWGSGMEIVTHKSTGSGRNNWEMQWVNRRIVGMWFRDKNSDFAWGMPQWLNSGIDQLLGTSALKGGRLEFKPGDWEKTTLRELARNDKIAKPSRMMSVSWAEFAKTEGASYQAGAFVRFLMNGPKGQTKGVLRKYMESLVEIIDEQKKKEKEKSPTKVRKELTEAEEEERFKKRKQAGKDRIKKIFDKSFGSWSDKKWKKFERAYTESVG